MVSRLGISIALAALVSITLEARAAAGTITGTITFDGKAPMMRPLQVAADPVCEQIHGDDPPLTDWLVLGEDQTVAWVLVRVVDGLGKRQWPVPQEPVVLSQQGCVYSPHVFGVRAGQPVKVLNPDETLHNIHPLPQVNNEFNRSMPKQVKETSFTFDKAEDVFTIKCDVHTWMRAYCAVFDHPFFDVTEQDGKFTLEGLPPGEYTIEAWHEKLGAQTAKVTVLEDGETTRDFTFTRPSR